MDASLSQNVNWEEIERSESYLVCCMFEEAASLSSHVLNRLSRVSSTKKMENMELFDMLESAGMVFIQSLKELGRTSEILNELKVLLGSVTTIPVSVLLTGACLQISDGSSSDLQIILEEFLGRWKRVDGQSYYVLADVDSESASDKKCSGCSFLETDKYLEVSELYALTLLGVVLNNTGLASSWLEKADLPEENRQEMLRRLCSVCSPEVSNSLPDCRTPQQAKKMAGFAISGSDSAISGAEGCSTTTGTMIKPAISRSPYPSVDCLFKLLNPFLWFRTINLKLGNNRLVAVHGSTMLWGSFFFIVCYTLRKKSAILKRTASRQAAALRKALIDMWQLAFSVQVNPLAAVQSLPVATRGSR